MLIIKITPTWFDTYNFLLILMIFWWFCRLCSTMKTLCDSDGCHCDLAGKITCVCRYPNQKLEITKDGVNLLPLMTSSVHIMDCSLVTIKRKSFEELKSLLRINLTNVKNLTLEEHSFSWNDSTIYESYLNYGIEIHIENASTILPSYVFRGRIDSIVFTNVYFETIRSYAFSSLAGSKVITFRNCVFLEVQDQAFKKFSLDRLNIIGGRISSTLPSRTMTDIAVKTEFQINGVVFDRIRSSAFRIHGPYTFHIQNCYVSHMEGEAFIVHTRGPVFVDDNTFQTMEEGAFIGLGVEKHVLDVSGHQEFIFENNTIGEVEKAALLFNINSFMPKIDWIYLNTRCKCESLSDWLSDLVVYSSQNYPEEKNTPNIKLDEIISCKSDDRYMRLKDYSKGYCEQHSQPFQMVVFGGIVAIFIVALFTVLYWYYHKNKKTRWMNVPQSSPVHEPVEDCSLQPQSPCYEEPSTSRRRMMVIPDGKTYRETELHVIVECAEPMQEYTSRIKERTQNKFEPVIHEYRNYCHFAGRNQLLTSDL